MKRVHGKSPAAARGRKTFSQAEASHTRNKMRVCSTTINVLFVVAPPVLIHPR